MAQSEKLLKAMTQASQLAARTRQTSVLIKEEAERTRKMVEEARALLAATPVVRIFPLDPPDGAD